MRRNFNVMNFQTNQLKLTACSVWSVSLVKTFHPEQGECCFTKGGQCAKITLAIIQQPLSAKNWVTHTQ